MMLVTAKRQRKANKETRMNTMHLFEIKESESPIEFLYRQRKKGGKVFRLQVLSALICPSSNTPKWCATSIRHQLQIVRYECCLQSKRSFASGCDLDFQDTALLQDYFISAFNIRISRHLTFQTHI